MCFRFLGGGGRGAGHGASGICIWRRCVEGGLDGVVMGAHRDHGGGGGGCGCPNDAEAAVRVLDEGAKCIGTGTA